MELTSKPGSITSGSNLPYWVESIGTPIHYSPLREHLKTDVVIIGGGMAGVSIAYCLVNAGKKVALVEDGYIGSGETGRTTAHLVTALDDRYYDLERMFGEDALKLIAESHREAINFVENNIRTESIDCDFERVNGYLFLHPTDDADALERELTSAKKAGIDVEGLDHIPGLDGPKQDSIRFSGQAQFHPLKYMKGLCDAIISKGGKIFTTTHAEEIDHTGIKTKDKFRINADHVVIATNSPVNNRFAIHLKQFPYRTYVIGAKIPKNSLPKALWWDTGDHSGNDGIPPYHYVRTQALDETNDLLIVGGEDHPTGLPEDDLKTELQRYILLERWMRERFTAGEIVYRWTGQVMEPMDSLAYIGRNPGDKNNVYVVTGDSGNGMTHASIAALLITDLINERKNRWEKIYDPSRFKIISAGKIFFRELVGGMMEYIKTKPSGEQPAQLIAGAGEIVKKNGKKYGVYRDEKNIIHIVSAACTHLHCTVKWNGEEKSWDCPCHGSRFTYDGKVINGPANMDLPYCTTS